MTVRIDQAGRIVVPKAVRDRLGIRPDSQIELIEQPEGALLKAPTAEPAMTMVGRVLVHHGVPERTIAWDRILDDAREERAQSNIRSYSEG